jgi:hypothetical protein
MVHVDPQTGTAFLNAATVPRVTKVPGAPNATLHHFLVFDVRAGAVESARDVWVRVTRRGAAAAAKNGGGAGEGVDAAVETETEVLRTVWGDGGAVRVVWDASEQRWDHVIAGGSEDGGGDGDEGDGAAAAGSRVEVSASSGLSASQAARS